MHKFNFKTKEMQHVFDNIKYVVDTENRISCEKEEATIVELFDQLFVGIPVEKLGTLTIGGFNSETTGFFLMGYQKLYFSIHGNIMYLRKRY